MRSRVCARDDGPKKNMKSFVNCHPALDAGPVDQKIAWYGTMVHRMFLVMRFLPLVEMTKNTAHTDSLNVISNGA